MFHTLLIMAVGWKTTELQLYKCSVYGSTTEVDTAVVSAFDLCAEMVSVTLPKENLKYQRLKQQEEPTKQRTAPHIRHHQEKGEYLESFQTANMLVIHFWVQKD